MKLFTKYSRVNLFATIGIFLFASAAFYFALRYILVRQMDEDLKIEQNEIQTFAKEHNSLPEPIPVKDQTISYAVTDQPVQKRRYSTRSRGVGQTVTEPRRVLVFPVKAGERWYAVTVSKSLERTDELIGSILLITSATILVILAVSVVINRILLKRLWKPFYDALGMVKAFKLDKKQSLHFPESRIDEFSFMNRILETTTGEAKRDYALLKEFTENASHEMQTPLSIIRSKLDLFIQQENLSEEQSKTIQSAYSAIEKLSRLNRSLLLMAKIENEQYSEISTVDLQARLAEKTEAFRELWQNQEIEVKTNLAKVTIKMNGELADILLNNLLSNATRHNFPGGCIEIELTERALSISNTGVPKPLESNRLFRRFYRKDDAGSTGLGLSIVKQICDISGFRVAYSFVDGHHIFVVSFY